MGGIELVFRHATIIVEDTSGERVRYEVKLYEPLLQSREPSLSTDEVSALYADFVVRHRDVPRKSEQFAHLLRSDPYFNAVRLKYGWAVTCHKAQGGEWQSVFVEFDGKYRGEESFRWVYTALTRSKNRAYLINAPDFGPGTQAAASLGESDVIHDALAREVREALAETDLVLRGTRKLSSALRCEIERRSDSVEVDVFFTGQGAVSQIKPARPDQPQPLLDAAIERLAPLLSWSSSSGQHERPPAAAEILTQFETVLAQQLETIGWQIARVRDMQHQVRYELATGDGRGTLSVHYKKNGDITSPRFDVDPGPEVRALVVRVLNSL